VDIDPDGVIVKRGGGDYGTISHGSILSKYRGTMPRLIHIVRGSRPASN
jgi:hypothetical protein